jgi:hypothetical protein
MYEQVGMKLCSCIQKLSPTYEGLLGKQHGQEKLTWRGIHILCQGPALARHQPGIQNHWVSGLSSSSRIPNRNHRAAGTGSVSILRWGEVAPTLFSPSERANFRGGWHLLCSVPQKELTSITAQPMKLKLKKQKLILRPMVSRPVLLHDGNPFGAHDQILNVL